MLKVKDYEIRWKHKANTDSSHKMDGTPRTSYKAVTSCSINIPDTILVWATARFSWDDNFSYETGRKPSLSRALKKTNLSKKERTMIWEAYRRMRGKLRW